jgi:hypothetical protein
MKPENPYVRAVVGLVFFTAALGLVIQVVAAIDVAIRRADEHASKTEREEEKVLAEKCKLLSNSARASVYITQEPLSLYICSDQGVSTYFVTRRLFPQVCSVGQSPAPYTRTTLSKQTTPLNETMTTTLRDHPLSGGLRAGYGRDRCFCSLT